MPTLDDIALSLGITKGTVSKALNGASDISEATRTAVLERAVELGYSKFSRENTRKVCILIENTKWQSPEDFGYELVGGFRKKAEPAGFLVDVIELTAEMQKSMTYDMFMLLHGYEGGFVIGLTYSDIWVQSLSESRTPLVVFDYVVKGTPHATSISIDNEEALELTVSHLKSLGHRKIGYLSGALGSFVFQRRYLAFFRALQQYKLPADRSQARHDYYMQQLIADELPPLIRNGCTAVICSHDALAHAVLVYCREKHIKVPEALSVIGFDDLPASASTLPPLTTIRQNRTELGKSAFYALFCQISDIPISSLQLHAELILRNTTDAPASDSAALSPG